MICPSTSQNNGHIRYICTLLTGSLKGCLVLRITIPKQISSKHVYVDLRTYENDFKRNNDEFSCKFTLLQFMINILILKSFVIHKFLFGIKIAIL